MSGLPDHVVCYVARVIGTGTDRDPYRADFPGDHAAVLACDADGRPRSWAVVFAGVVAVPETAGRRAVYGPGDDRSGPLGPDQAGRIASVVGRAPIGTTRTRVAAELVADHLRPPVRGVVATARFRDMERDA